MDKAMKIDLICDDAISAVKELPDRSVNLIIADPPYNLEKDYGATKDDLSHSAFLDFSRDWLAECRRVLMDDGTIYVFMGMRYIAYIYTMLERELELNFQNWITWFYTQGIGKTKGFSPRHDDILAFSKSSKIIFNLDAVRVPQKYYRSVNNMRGANPGNVWEFSHIHYCSGSRQQHPTQKPEGLYERMVLASSNEGEMVLDPFIGSGTCARVCQQLNRNCIGIDNNEQYIELAKKRLLETFNGFDSMDVRMKRIPNDLTDELRDEYIKNHKRWFLKNHESEIERFMGDVNAKYPVQPSLFS
jgi:site-specific DNA-methyltransferase (adenine-specific)